MQETGSLLGEPRSGCAQSPAPHCPGGGGGRDPSCRSTSHLGSAVPTGAGHLPECTAGRRRPLWLHPAARTERCSRCRPRSVALRDPGACIGIRGNGDSTRNAAREKPRRCCQQSLQPALGLSVTSPACGQASGRVSTQSALAAAPRRMTTSEAEQPCGRGARVRMSAAGCGTSPGRGGGEPGGARGCGGLGVPASCALRPSGKVQEVFRLGFCEPTAVCLTLLCPELLSLKKHCLL